MYRLFRPTVPAAALAILAAAPLAAQRQAPVVSLKISRESAPPGGMAQVKVFITEPQPITTGGGRLSFDAYDSIEGIALTSPDNDTYGVALVDGATMSLGLVSPSATFGTAPDYPALTVAGFVDPLTPPGTKFPVAFDSLWLADASGTVYPTEVKAGHLVTQTGLSIHDVKPGSGDLPAGAVVSIFGSSFQPLTTVRFKETKLTAIRYVGPNQIDVVVAGPVRMHGTEIQMANPDGERVEYFSYQRTRRADASVRPAFATMVPIFPYRETLAAGVSVAGAASGLAVQNLRASSATVTAELFRADGVLLGTRDFTVAPDRYVVQELDELIAPYGAAATVCVRSATLVQVMGIAVDGGAARPLIPATTLPSVCQ
jgi:hypothetical protein